jgi:hypothetical protein
MTVALKSSDLVLEHQPSMDLQRIMYFVKRPSYELAFVVPDALQAMHGGRGCCYLHFKTTCQAGGFVLDLRNLASFYDDVSGMLEYVRNEREKPRPSTLSS